MYVDGRSDLILFIRDSTALFELVVELPFTSCNTTRNTSLKWPHPPFLRLDISPKCDMRRLMPASTEPVPYVLTHSPTAVPAKRVLISSLSECKLSLTNSIDGREIPSGCCNLSAISPRLNLFVLPSPLLINTKLRSERAAHPCFRPTPFSPIVSANFPS